MRNLTNSFASWLIWLTGRSIDSIIYTVEAISTQSFNILSITFTPRAALTQHFPRNEPKPSKKAQTSRSERRQCSIALFWTPKTKLLRILPCTSSSKPLHLIPASGNVTDSPSSGEGKLRQLSHLIPAFVCFDEDGEWAVEFCLLATRLLVQRALGAKKTTCHLIWYGATLLFSRNASAHLQHLKRLLRGRRNASL